MAQMPSNLGPLALPQPGRAVASVDLTGPAQAQMQGARAIKGGLNDLAGGLESASAALYNRKMQDEEREVKQLDVEFAKQRRIISGQFRTTQGQATLDARPKLDAQYMQAKEEILKKASSGRVKSAFSLLADGKTQIDLEQHDVYTEDQRRQANLDASNAIMAESYQSAAEDPLNPAVAILSQRNIEGEVLAQKKIRGWSDEVTKSKMESAISQLYKTRIEAAAKDHPGEAWKIYEDNKENIDGDVRVEIEKFLEETTLDTLAQGYAEQAIAAFPGDIKAQRAYIRERLNGKEEIKAIDELNSRLVEYQSDVRWRDYLEDQAYQRVAREDALKKKAEVDLANTAQDSLNKWLHDNPGVNTIEQWQRDNKDLYEGLLKDTYKFETMERVEKRILEDSQYATVTVSDSALRYNGMNIEDLARVTDSELESEKANMTQTDWTKLVRRVNGARSSIEAAKGATASIYNSANNVLSQLLPRKNNKPTGKIKITDKQYNAVQADLYAFIDEQVEGGHIPKHDELYAETQRLVTKLYSDPVNSTGWGKGPLGYWAPAEGEEAFDGIVAEYQNLSPKQKEVAIVPYEDIPPEMLKYAQDIFAKKGIKPTQNQLENFVGAYVTNNVERANRILLGK